MITNQPSPRPLHESLVTDLNTAFPDAFPPINFKEDLNEEQFAAISAPIGPVLVLAGAGSGKTRTLTYRVAWLLTQGICPWEILLLTFTNKAANEMLLRVENLTGIPHYKFWGGTFHHIGQKILRIHGESIGINKNFNILDASDADSLLSEVIRNFDAQFFRNTDNPKSRVIGEIISYARNTCSSIEQVVKEKYPYFAHLLQNILLFNKNYQDLKKKRGVLDYDDLLEHWLSLLENNSSIKEHLQHQFKYILVDEYQDTNTLQSKIIDRMTPYHKIMAVGDDAQCIYTWRGANFENIMTFADRHPGTLIFKIETNYRSTPEILDLANQVLEHQPANAGYRKELKPTRRPKQKPYFASASDTKHQAQFILKRIKGLLSEGYNYSDIAILYRAHFHAMDLQMELTRLAIPYQITSGIRFFEQAHIKDLVAQLKFAANPADSTSFFRFACLLPKMGPKTAEKLLQLGVESSKKNQTSLLKALEHESIIKKVPATAKDDWLDMIYTLQDVTENIHKLPPKDITSIAIEGWYGTFLRSLYPNWQSRQDDLQSLIGFATRFDNMQEFLAQLVLLNSETSDRAADLNEDNLRLTTIHQAKGLEFPVVFIIGLAESLFPSKRSLEEDNLEEERRLFYVAVTRAKDELYLTHPRLSFQGGPPALLSPSRFIQELSKDAYQTLSLPNSYY